jgi:glycosyltransferase involved in cell wall biosynthesis
MKVLLLGEYSRLHNSLKEGLLELCHEVVIVSNGDGFKKYPADYNIEAKISKSKVLNPIRKLIYKVLNYDLIKFEQGVRFYFLLPKLKNFDVVQLINERPIQTHSWLEIFLLKKIFKNNKKVFLLSSGVDYINVTFLLTGKLHKTIIQPYIDNPALKKEYGYVLDYITKNNKKIHDFVYNNCKGIIASDMDYVLPLTGNKKFIGLVPNAVNHHKIDFSPLDLSEKIIIFLGINQWNSIQKGIIYFEKALEIIKKRYSDKVEIIIVKNIPYKDYINLYNKAHILLDQCYAYDQGYNALEAMAKGKVVFTGAEKEFLEHYNLQEDEVAINAKSDVSYLVEKLSMLIEKPEKIIQIGKNARAFIEKEHDYIKIAEKYLSTWNVN